MDKILKLSIILGIFIVCISVAYYLVIFLPQQAQNELNFEKEQAAQKIQEQEQEQKLVLEEQTERQMKLHICLSGVEANYIKDWQINCESLGIDTTNKDCKLLPTNQADNLSQLRKDEDADCFKEYPQN